jgi:plastocyanin
MRALPIALLVTAVAAAPASAAECRTAPANAARCTVKLGDDWYVQAGAPQTVTVAKGTVVRWRWTGRDDHNVVVRRGPRRFRSDLKDSGTYRKRMRRGGTYKIICSIHQPDMRMTLRVSA